MIAELIEEEEAFQSYRDQRRSFGVGQSTSATMNRRKTEDAETERRRRIRNNFSRLVNF